MFTGLVCIILKLCFLFVSFGNWDIQHYIMNHVLNIGYCITGFTLVILLLQHYDKKPTRYAMLLIFMWFCKFLALYLEASVDLFQFPFLVLFDQNLFFLDGVLLYWYVCSYDNRLTVKRKLLNLIPFFVSILYTMSIYIRYSTEELVNFHYEVIESLYSGTYSLTIDGAINISIMILVNLYFFRKSIRLLKEYKGLLLNNYSNLHNLEVSWLQKLVKFWFVMFFVPFVFYYLTGISVMFPIQYIEKIALLGMILTASFFCINVIIQRYPEKSLEKVSTSNKVKLKINSPEDTEKLHFISEYMCANKPYLDVNLTLESLSRDIGIKPTEVSRIINSQNGTNFHEFVNGYRIDQIKSELILSQEQIIIIAYNNGFNSKSTFNSVFKKNTGLTPSQFRKRNKSDNV